jgi:hypothetical protein
MINDLHRRLDQHLMMFVNNPAGMAEARAPAAPIRAPAFAEPLAPLPFSGPPTARDGDAILRRTVLDGSRPGDAG